MSEIKTKVQELTDMLTATLADAEKFDAGNNAAGVRVRKTLATVRTLSHALRQRIMEVRKERGGCTES